MSFRQEDLKQLKPWRNSLATAAVACLAIISLGIVSGVMPALGANDSSQQKQISNQMGDIRSQMGEMSQDAADLLAKIDKLNQRKDELAKQTSALQGQISGVETELADANARLASVQRSIDQAQVKLDDATRQMNENKGKLEAHAVDAYMGGEANENLAGFLLRGGDLRDITAADEYRSQVVTDRKTLLEHQRELEGQARDARDELARIRAAAEADRALIEQRQAQLVVQKASLVDVQNQVAAEAQQQSIVLGEVETKRAQLQAELDGLQRQSDAIAERIRRQQAENASRTSRPAPTTSKGRPAPAGRGILGNPVPGMPMTSPFGMRLHPVLGTYRLHAGQDFSAPSGTPILSAGDGEVISVMTPGESGGYGNYTCVDHGGGLATCYAHQSRVLISEGQSVKRGQVIGLVGSTGLSSGPHLHFEVRVNGTPVDPRSYM